jgi:hypothetical protein
MGYLKLPSPLVTKGIEIVQNLLEQATGGTAGTEKRDPNFFSLIDQFFLTELRDYNISL